VRTAGAAGEGEGVAEGLEARLGDAEGPDAQAVGRLGLEALRGLCRDQYLDQ
jgi:hypothetical protein